VTVHVTKTVNYTNTLIAVFQANFSYPVLPQLVPKQKPWVKRQWLLRVDDLPDRYPTNSIKALKEIHNNEPPPTNGLVSPFLHPPLDS